MSQCVVLLAKETLLSKCPSLSRCIKLVVVIKCSSGVGGLGGGVGGETF